MKQAVQKERSSHCRLGFTFAEVLIALLIFAASSTTLLTALALSMRQSGAGSDYLVACGLLERGLDEVRRDLVSDAAFELVSNRLVAISPAQIQSSLFYKRDSIRVPAGDPDIFFMASFTVELINTHVDLIGRPPLLPGLHNATNGLAVPPAPSSPVDYENNIAGSFPSFMAASPAKYGLLKVIYTVWDITGETVVEATHLFSRRIPYQ